MLCHGMAHTRVDSCDSWTPHAQPVLHFPCKWSLQRSLCPVSRYSVPVHHSQSSRGRRSRYCVLTRYWMHWHTTDDGLSRTHVESTGQIFHPLHPLAPERKPSVTDSAFMHPIFSLKQPDSEIMELGLSIRHRRGSLTACESVTLVMCEAPSCAAAGAPLLFEAISVVETWCPNMTCSKPAGSKRSSAITQEHGSHHME